MSDFDDYLDGMRDCRNDKDPQKGASQHYYDGYNAQYALEQVQTAQSLAAEQARKTDKLLMEDI